MRKKINEYLNKPLTRKVYLQDFVAGSMLSMIMFGIGIIVIDKDEIAKTIKRKVKGEKE